LISANGSKYIGRFKQDKKHGHGEMIFADDQIFEEVWQNGILISHQKRDINAAELQHNKSDHAINKSGTTSLSNKSRISITQGGTVNKESRSNTKNPQ
jgi:hypothetical protein